MTRDVQLVRAGVVGLREGEFLADHGLDLSIGDLAVSSIKTLRFDGCLLKLVCATVSLQAPIDLDVDVVEIPERERRLAELGIESVARLTALEERTGHSGFSPMPYVGFQSEDPSVLDQLAGKTVDTPAMLTVPAPPAAPAGLLTPPILEALVDRLEGVALLAEALNSRTALGQHHELLRVFERPSHCPPNRLEKDSPFF